MKASLAVMAVGLLMVGCSEKQPQESKSTNSSSGNPLTAPVDYLGAAGKAKKHIEKTLDTVGIKQAIQMFQASEGRYPKDLQELVAGKYLPSLPQPPAGMKFQYDSKTGDLKIVEQ